MRVIQVIAALEQPLKAFLLSLPRQMFVDCFNQNWSVGIIMNQIGTTNLQITQYFLKYHVNSINQMKSVVLQQFR